MRRRRALHRSVLRSGAGKGQGDKGTSGAYGGDKPRSNGGIIGKLKAKKFMTYSHENMILVCPPLIITPEQLREEMVSLTRSSPEVDALFKRKDR